MKAIFSKIVNKVHSRAVHHIPDYQSPKKERKPRNKEESQMGSIPSDEEQESQVVDILIKMKNTLKITKINSALQGQYQTLRHINRMLYSNPLKSGQIRVFLLTKSSQKIQIQEDMDKDSPASSRMIQHYTLYSNGLIYQYYSVRALLWKVSLGYLPATKNKWVSFMEGNLICYHQFIKEHILDVVVKKKKRTESLENLKGPISPEKRSETLYEKKQPFDHPLNVLKESKWKTLFEDRQIWAIIEKDTRRTKPNCLFFQQKFQIDIDKTERNGVQNCEVHLSKEEGRKTYYYDCITRIIYIFMKTHPDVMYCQGMNQLAALLFYSFANKNSEYFRRVAQSDAFFCFQVVMKELCRLPIPGFLNGQKYAQRFEELLKKIDLRLFEDLQAQSGSLNSLRILSIKWFGSFFLSEYQIDESLILWDGFIATISKEGNTSISFHNLLLSVGLALVHLNRNALSQGQNPLMVFAKAPNPPEEVLQKAMNLYKIFGQFY